MSVQENGGAVLHHAGRYRWLLELTEDIITDKAVEALLVPWLRQHGIDATGNPTWIIKGTWIQVVEDPDGVQWVQTWVADRKLPSCPTCPPGCILQQPVEAKLIAPPPDIPAAKVIRVGP